MNLIEATLEAKSIYESKTPYTLLEATSADNKSVDMTFQHYNGNQVKITLSLGKNEFLDGTAFSLFLTRTLFHLNFLGSYSNNRPLDASPSSV